MTSTPKPTNVKPSKHSDVTPTTLPSANSATLQSVVPSQKRSSRSNKEEKLPKKSKKPNDDENESDQDSDGKDSVVSKPQEGRAEDDDNDDDNDEDNWDDIVSETEEGKDGDDKGKKLWYCKHCGMGDNDRHYMKQHMKVCEFQR